MDAAILQDRISRGLGTAARRIGASTDAYRPRGTSDPLARANRFLRLPAAFSGPDGKFARPNGYGDALWFGVFDAAYTRPGDYLVQGGSIWFVAAQQPLLPVLCVQTNRTVAFRRPAAPGGVGVNSYGGIALSTATPLISGWPASVLGASPGNRPSANLPSDSSVGTWTVLLPAVEDVVLRPADLMTDDLDRTGIVASAEITDLGWRLTVKQAST
ncbi:MAG: hypothetical protein J0H14_05940 [Alphaproteobacteria bacterium]|nr:hypothetical protein [Alphaproteobacteria bacterium]